jgi:multiple sugar transport system permease protein
MAGNKKKVLFITMATILLLFCIFPYLYMVLQSLAPWDQVDKSLFPSALTLRSYVFLKTGGGQISMPWIQSFFNSMIVSFASTFLQLVTAMLAAYAISIIKIRGAKLFENFILFQMFFPTIIFILPNFIIIKSLMISNSYLGMILPLSVSAWAVFIYENFFQGIPKDIINAAKIDGASEFRVARSIVLPMSRSITTILFLFLFMGRWNELMWDMIAVTDVKLKTLNVLLSSMFGPYGGYPGPLYAASVILSVPLIILFLIFSKNFKEGMNFVLK